MSPKLQILAKILLSITIICVFYFAINWRTGYMSQFDQIKKIIKSNGNQPVKEKIIIKEIKEVKTIKEVQKKKEKKLTSEEFFSQCSNYQQNCMNLFKNLRYPDKKSVFRPALKEIPKDLYDAFTMNGYMPLTKTWYFNEVFGDADSNNKNAKAPVDRQSFENYRKKVREWQPLGYEDQSMHKVFEMYKENINKKSMVVIGTISPWIEAMAYEYNASQITTLDYTRKKWHDSKLSWYHVNDYLEEAMRENKIEKLDNAATFSSIEHSGLGRFGDPLNPDGDLDVMKQVHCMLKPGGMFIVGALENVKKEKGELQFNAQRIYGTKRLELLFKGWDLIKEEEKNNVFILKKKACA